MVKDYTKMPYTVRLLWIIAGVYLAIRVVLIGGGIIAGACFFASCVLAGDLFARWITDEN